MLGWTSQNESCPVQPVLAHNNCASMVCVCVCVSQPSSCIYFRCSCSSAIMLQAYWLSPVECLALWEIRWSWNPFWLCSPSLCFSPALPKRLKWCFYGMFAMLPEAFIKLTSDYWSHNKPTIRLVISPWLTTQKSLLNWAVIWSLELPGQTLASCSCVKYWSTHH